MSFSIKAMIDNFVVQSPEPAVKKSINLQNGTEIQ